eukprot:TRINITY_DN28684_c0_g1_i1.p1 TRINITY_DN28684_c0_g1~~TRINITY_DN28684_c0_g1_i1.p1  ORF type:complete len:553 (+),score=68.32 TRINITY_DN28684_c0_g1_i1:434-2092(+)
MAFAGPAFGLQGLLKEGHKHLSGLEEAVLKNIEACKQLAQITRTSLGPNGMNKMIINHLDKLFVTSDAATIVAELEVAHPAAKLLVLAARAQQEEVGDGANTVVSLAGELVAGAEELIRSGLHPSEIIAGYGKATDKVLEYLAELVAEGSDKVDVRDKAEVEKRLVAAVASKQFGSETTLCPLIADACMQVCPSNPASFNVDNVRVAKVLGGGLHDSSVVRGMVLKTDATGTIKHKEKAKIAVFGQGLDSQATDTKGTVLIENAEQLETYAKSEESKMEEMIKAVADSGATVVVSGQTVGEMALHFCERYKLMVLKIGSKFELRRFCRTTGAVSLVKLQRPMADELGFADSVTVKEIGGSTVVVIENASGGNLVSTVVLRGSTDSILDDVERAVDDGINTYKALCRDSRVVPGGGATEIELARRLKQFGRTQVGLDQYAIEKYSEALEVIPRTLAENAGLDVTEILSALYAAHAGSGAEGVGANPRVGVDVTGAGVRDLTTDNIWDLYATKYWAIRFAADAVTTVLRVDQIIMAKVAGGPRRGDRPMDESED